MPVLFFLSFSIFFYQKVLTDILPHDIIAVSKDTIKERQVKEP